MTYSLIGIALIGMIYVGYCKKQRVSLIKGNFETRFTLLITNPNTLEDSRETVNAKISSRFILLIAALIFSAGYYSAPIFTIQII